MLWIAIIEKENPHTKFVQFDGVGSKDGCQALQTILHTLIALKEIPE